MVTCPLCQTAMREQCNRYKCQKCGCSYNKTSNFNNEVSPKVPVDLRPRHGGTPNMAGLFWLLYIAGFVLGLFFLLVWLNECNIFNFIGGI
jgi:hypothetical protein